MFWAGSNRTFRQLSEATVYSGRLSRGRSSPPMRPRRPRRIPWRSSSGLARTWIPRPRGSSRQVASGVPTGSSRSNLTRVSFAGVGVMRVQHVNRVLGRGGDWGGGGVLLMIS